MIKGLIDVKKSIINDFKKELMIMKLDENNKKQERKLKIIRKYLPCSIKKELHE